MCVVFVCVCYTCRCSCVRVKHERRARAQQIRTTCWASVAKPRTHDHHHIIIVVGTSGCRRDIKCYFEANEKRNKIKMKSSLLIRSARAVFASVHNSHCYLITKRFFVVVGRECVCGILCDRSCSWVCAYNEYPKQRSHDSGNNRRHNHAQQQHTTTKPHLHKNIKRLSYNVHTNIQKNGARSGSSSPRFHVLRHNGCGRSPSL